MLVCAGIEQAPARVDAGMKQDRSLDKTCSLIGQSHLLTLSAGHSSSVPMPTYARGRSCKSLISNVVQKRPQMWTDDPIPVQGPRELTCLDNDRWSERLHKGMQRMEGTMLTA
jgi:hypothetical protein